MFCWWVERSVGACYICSVVFNPSPPSSVFCVVVLSFVEGGVSKAPVTAVELSVSPFSCSGGHVLGALLLGGCGLPGL